jgi:hypothetical protein
MQSQLINIFSLSLVSMFKPALLAAVTAMPLLPSPNALMFGYLLGAYTASMTVGLVIVSALHSSSTESIARHTIGPVEDIIVGLIAVLIAGRDGRDRGRGPASAAGAVARRQGCVASSPGRS